MKYWRGLFGRLSGSPDDPPGYEKGQLLAEFRNCFLNAGQAFNADLCSLRASALTFYSMLSIVPVIAMLFGVAKGFGFEAMLQQKLLQQIPQQETMMLQLIDFSRNMLESARGGVVAGIGIVVLFVTVIKMVSNIENSFNHIWKLKHGRSLVRKINDYLSPILLAPVLLIISSSITVMVRAKISELSVYEYVPDQGVRLVLYTLNYIPFLILWGLFTFLFVYLPNTRVNLKPGIVAGLFTAAGFQLLQWAFISLQIGVSGYNVIYGGFAAVPLFVTWLQMTWMVVLFGSELSFSLQNPQARASDPGKPALSIRLQKRIALRIVHLIVRGFCRREAPLAASAIAASLELPVNRVEAVLGMLEAGGVVAWTKSDEVSGPVYLPAQDTQTMTVVSVLEDLESSGETSLAGMNDEDWVVSIADSFADYVKQWDHNSLIKNIDCV